MNAQDPIVSILVLAGGLAVLIAGIIFVMVRVRINKAKKLSQQQAQQQNVAK